MGGQCSAKLARPVGLDDMGHCGQRPCGQFDDLACQEECHLCEDDDGGAPALSSEHPLLKAHLASDDTPRTPRGPTPPWVVAAANLKAPIDRTATGATPPRSPTPPRVTPPGLPDEEAQPSGPSVATLAAAFDAKLAQELFGAARTGNSQVLNLLLRQLHSTALTQICKGTRPGDDSTLTAERCERANELVAGFLCKVREARATSMQETVLGVACSGGHVEAVRLLLTTRADPSGTDDDGSCALHRAAQSAHLTCVLVVLDRLQANNRSIQVADLANHDGETPETIACHAGAADVARAFEVFHEMQSDAEARQLGSSWTTSAGDAAGSHRGGVGTGDQVAFLDLAAEVSSPAALLAAGLLRRATAGTRLVKALFQRIPDDEVQLRALIEDASAGLRKAEALLLGTAWDPADPTLDPAVRSFVATAELRSSWQRLRAEATREEGEEAATALEEFWQTHFTAEMMISTMRSATGDTFQLLLTVLWLYTREAWLRHILDGLAAAVNTVSLTPGAPGAAPAAGDGATGATSSWPAGLPVALRPVAPLLEALAPCAQLVQSSLSWFEEAGIRHSAVTYRPLNLQMLGVQRLVDRYVAARRAAGGGDAKDAPADPGTGALTTGTWIALGAGSFFSSMSSRTEAIRRLARTRCNVLLCIRPDDTGPCYPKHMMLRGSNVDDTLFPLDALFRITRITRTLSSELDPDICKGATSRWPVTVIELVSASRFLEALEWLDSRGELKEGELEARLEEWVTSSPHTEERSRLKAAAQLLDARLAAVLPTVPAGAKRPPALQRRAEKARDFRVRAAADRRPSASGSDGHGSQPQSRVPAWG